MRTGKTADLGFAWCSRNIDVNYRMKWDSLQLARRQGSFISLALNVVVLVPGLTSSNVTDLVSLYSH